MSTFQTPEPISATVDLALGAVRIVAGERDATVVELRPSDESNAEDVRAADGTRVEYANEQLVVKAPKLRSWVSRKGGSIDVTIELPAGSNLDCTARLADVHCEGRLGDCRVRTGLGRIRLDDAAALDLKSGMGDISVERATGHAEVTTGSGQLRLRELDGSAVIKNSNGDTWVGLAGGSARLSAANGRIAVDRARAAGVAKSANGDVRMGEVVRGSVVLETTAGDLEVGIRAGSAAWLDVHTAVGQVHNALEAAEAPGPSAETVEVRARTTVGDIAILRSGP
jgi:DUF4097 and DUF4098 domain-containing protein YvlB